MDDIYPGLEALLQAAELACDHHQDGEQARAEMRAAVLDTPLYMRLDLLAHFAQNYPQQHK